MSLSVVCNSTVQVGNQTLAENKTITGEGTINRSPSVPAAKNGALTTRTDANTGVVTMDAGHGLATSDVVDAYWTNSDGTKGYRVGMTCTVATNAVTVDGGSGDDLPVLTTTVRLMKPVEETLPQISATGFKVLALSSPVPARMDIQDGSGSLLEKIFKKATGGLWQWHEEMPDANPITGETATKIVLSHGEITAQTLNLAVLFD